MTDATNRNRVQRGVSTGGQFATETKAEPAGGTHALTAPSPSRRPHLDDTMNRAIVEVVNGPLSRGVANRERRARFLQLRDPAHRPEFTAGMDDTIRTLYGHRMNPSASTEELVEFAGLKRTRQADRVFWLEDLHHLPEQAKALDQDGAAEFKRGRIAGALALSGMDAQYDLSRPVPEPDFEPREVSSLSMNGDTYYVVSTREPEVYAVFREDEDGDEEIGDFPYSGDPDEQDAHWEIQRLAIDELEQNGITEDIDEVPDNVVTTVEFGGTEFEIDLNDAEPHQYTVYRDGEELASFSYAGDPEDHDELQGAALRELEASGEIEVCSGENCSNSLDDGEGWDGKCGDCADRAENDDEDDEDSPVCELCNTRLTRDEAALTKPVLMCTDCRDEGTE